MKTYLQNERTNIPNISEVKEYLKSCSYEYQHDKFLCGVDMYDIFTNGRLIVYLYCFGGNDYFTICTTTPQRNLLWNKRNYNNKLNSIFKIIINLFNLKKVLQH